jgi:hypothetical protein
MRQPALGPWLAVGVLALALGGGCTRCACRSGLRRPEFAAVPAVPTPQPVVVGRLAPPPSAVESPTVAPSPMAPVAEVVPMDPPAVAQAVPSLPPAAPTPDPDVVQSGHALPPFPELKEELARRLPTQQDAAAGLAHAPDYSWLSGELQYVAVRNAWRLRYATGDEDDRYGGSVTLVEPAQLGEADNGKRVRVEGRLLDPASREPSPAYRVRTLQLLP